MGKKDIEALSKQNTNSVRNEASRLRLALMKENAAYRTFWNEFGGDKVATAYSFVFTPISIEQSFKLFKEEKAAFSIINAFTKKLYKFGIAYPISGLFPSEDSYKAPFVRHPLDEPIINKKLTRIDGMKLCLDALNPYKDVPEQLPFQFSDSSSIVQIVFHDVPLKLVDGELIAEPIEGRCHLLHDIKTPISLKPSERILRVDLSRKKRDLLEDFSTFIDDVYRSSNKKRAPWDSATENYEQWERDNSRYREECWIHLKVWQLRRQRKSYATIARELKIKIPAAKKSFARAFELIEGRKYEAKLFKQYNKVDSKELKRTCDNCSVRSSYDELCPDVIHYVIQDDVAQKEFIPKALEKIEDNYSNLWPTGCSKTPKRTH